jgi:hypothetical protein
MFEKARLIYILEQEATIFPSRRPPKLRQEEQEKRSRRAANMGKFEKGVSGNPATRFRKGVSGNPAGGGVPKAPPYYAPAPAPVPADGKPADIVKMAQLASGGAMQWLIDLAHGKVKGASIDHRIKAVAMLHERAYGKPAQIISIDIALKRAIEGHDPVEQLRILQDMRSRYVAQLEAPIEITAEVLEDA